MGLTSFKLRETDTYFLVGKSLKSFFGLGQNLLFYEIPIGSSRADIVYFQEPMAYETLLPAGIHVFEVKMRWDKDKRRLKKQIKDYLKYVDYVWVVGINRVFELDDEHVGVLVFSTSKTEIEVVKEARYEPVGKDKFKRQVLLKDLEKSLKKKLKSIQRMRFVEPSNENLLVQEMLKIE